MATYQLEGTVYSAGPASPDLHSSPQRPHLENTTDTSLVDTQAPSQHNLSNSSTTNNNKSSTKSNSNMDNNSRIPSNRDGSNKSSEKDPNITKDTENITLSVVNNSKATMRNTGSSLREISNTRDEVVGGSSREEVREIESAEVEDAMTETGHGGSGDGEASDDIWNSHSKINLPLRLVSIVGDLVSNINLENKEVRSETTSKDSSGLEATPGRQNDGPNRPKCASKTCGNRKKSQTPPLSNYSDDDDEGIRNLRRIIQEAQASIKKFQMDFQLEGASKNTSDSFSKWASIDARHNTSDITINGTTADKQRTRIKDDCEDEEIGSSKNTEGEERNEGDHKVRHHHRKHGHRRHSTLREGGADEQDKGEATVQKPALPTVTSFLPNIVTHHPALTTTQHPSSPSNSPFESSSTSSLSSTTQSTLFSHPSLTHSTRRSKSPPSFSPIPVHSGLASRSSPRAHTPTLTLWDTWATLLDTGTQTNTHSKSDSLAETVLENPVEAQERIRPPNYGHITKRKKNNEEVTQRRENSETTTENGLGSD